jgi:hypothetical protein
MASSSPTADTSSPRPVPHSTPVITDEHDGAVIHWADEADEEQFLARADKVRTLHQRNEHTGDCEYCSARDYPDYAVPHPCVNGEEPQS